MKLISSRKFAKRRYNNIAFEGVWADSFGTPEWGSRWLVYGRSGEGKTEFCCQLAGYMANFGKVIYISAEQGDASTMQSAWRRNKLLEKNNVYLGIGVDVPGIMKEAKKRGKPKLIIIDSIDFINLTSREYVTLDICAKKHMLVTVSWSDAKKPKTQAGKDIEYMCDGKIFVDNYVAFCKVRSGGNAPYIVWQEKAKEKHSFINR